MTWVDLGWLLVLLILFRHFWCKRQVLMQAKSWLQVKGRIIVCEWSEVGHSVWPKIEYSYQIEDKDLTGEYLFLDTAHNNPNSKYSRSVAYKAAVAYKENAEIDVYYNPNAPEQSALDVTVPVKLNIILLMIGFLLLVHLSFIAWHFFSLYHFH